jgi:hypothetical protein
MLDEERAAGMLQEKYYSGFAAKVISVKETLIELLRTIKAQAKRIAAYGAAAKGATLLNYCGIGAYIDFVVDRSPHKQGLYLPGSRLPIVSPERLVDEMPEYTLILPWNIAGEVLEQQTQYRLLGGRFIVPIPAPTVIA